MSKKTTSPRAAGLVASSEPLEADQYLRKDNSLFDPFMQTANRNEGSTSQKSVKDDQSGQEQGKEVAATECKKCSYNFNEESECRNLPFEMFPLSEDEPAAHDCGDEHSEPRHSDRRRKFVPISKPAMKRNEENAEQQPGEGRGPIEQGQLSRLKRGNKKIIKSDRKNKTKKISCKCKKTHCIKSYCECFISNVGCNTNCQCLDCANWTQPSKVPKKATLGGKQKKLSKAPRSCQCKKTNCIKNYCECFHSGRPCGMDCNCMGCENRGA